MLRPATLSALVLVAGAVGAVFFVSHEVRALDQRLMDLNQKILSNYKALHVLHAEWNHLSRPQRLAELAVRHLDLTPLSGNQLARRRPARQTLVAVRVVEPPVAPRADANDTDIAANDLALTAAIDPAVLADRRSAARQAQGGRRTRAAGVGELTAHRPIDAIEELVGHVIRIGRNRGRR